MRELNQIDTFYDNLYFRSRTEARWAVFFNAIGWEYLYEFEGYNLPIGCYLPDFYFPKLNVWAEVKPGELNEIELTKCKELSFKMKSNDLGIDVILLEGVPSFKSLRTISNGQIWINVILLSVYERNYPFYTSDDYPKKHYMLDRTDEAIIKARTARFEYEWKERNNG